MFYNLLVWSSVNMILKDLKRNFCNKNNAVTLPLKFFKMTLTFLKSFYLFIFREKGREGEREGEKHRCERKT